jgi:DNA-binding Lrp family transcriptional regulator
MVTAFVLISTSKGSIDKTAQSLVKTKYISEVYSVTGDWDLVAVVKIKNSEQLPILINKKIQKIEGVERTTTLVAFQVFNKDAFERVFSIGF